ncbi:hypothetical protein ACFVT9_33365, partial [Kitasatospora cineracea]
MNLSGDPVADRQDGFPAGELAPGEAADRAVAGILDAVVRPAPGAPRGVVVDSPPGAGKSTLVVRAAREL